MDNTNHLEQVTRKVNKNESTILDKRNDAYNNSNVCNNSKR